MTPTVEYLEERFDTFNRMCFDGALPRIPIKLSRARTFVGRLIYRPVRDWRGRVVRREDFVLRISTYFDLPEAEIEDTLIHEMIHYWIAWKGIKDTSSHGKEFRRIMKEINALHGRHLTISHKSTPEEQDRDTRVRDHYFCVSQLADGRTALTVAAQPCIARIRRAFRWSPTVRSQTWYHSRDPWFNRYPHCRSPKIFPVDPAVLQPHLDAAELFNFS
ncbi:MAG: SprT-like domain-containing protein [Bacteroidales bacterium]|nr:SprT-like domain-containing protein [Bacteroidales bacterium]MDY6443955.1 SprT-like domain-containing protein [Bacteroidales bacterium]